MSHPLRTLLRLGSLLLLQVLIRYAALAQQLPGLIGVVRDSVSRQPVAYATVVLLPPSPGGSHLAGGITDRQGSFALTKLAPGLFRLQVSLVGYAARTQSVV
ncbi:MAG: carboxypeptidase-like regulatory domain-containing protein, partial [Hymenobacter sp.]